MAEIMQALADLNERIVAAEAVGQALDLAAGEQAPPWVYVFRNQIDAISQAAEVLETRIREAAHVRAD